MIWRFFNPQEIGLASLSKFWHILHPGIIEHRIDHTKSKNPEVSKNKTEKI